MERIEEMEGKNQDPDPKGKEQMIKPLAQVGAKTAVGVPKRKVRVEAGAGRKVAELEAGAGSKSLGKKIELIYTQL